MSNLVHVLQRQGRVEEANLLENRLARLEPNRPLLFSAGVFWPWKTAPPAVTMTCTPPNWNASRPSGCIDGLFFQLLFAIYFIAVCAFCMRLVAIIYTQKHHAV
jgi:hypothetical protein